MAFFKKRRQHCGYEIGHRLLATIRLGTERCLLLQHVVRIGGHSSRQLDRGPVCQPRQFQFGQDVLLATPQRENEILVDDEPNDCAGPDRDRWLDLEIARRDLVAGTRNVLLGRFADRLH